MLGIVVSRADEASVHIGEHLLDLGDWTRREDGSLPDSEGGGAVYETDGAQLREFEELHLDLERPAEAFDDASLLAFASRHSGETGPLLTAHHTGNFGPADHGGDPDAVARACPNAHARVLDALAEHAPEGYEVGMECTHHGPTDVGAPSMFVEVGSSEPHWADPDAARAVARAILDLRGVAPDRPPSGSGEQRTDDDRPPAGSGDREIDDNRTRRHLVGIGGGHYAPRFERITRETDWAVGHVAADWGLEALDARDDAETRAVLNAAFAESRAAYALSDGSHPDVEAAVDSLGYRVVSETWVRETAGVDLAFVRAIEAAVAPVDDGLQFGDAATNVDGIPEFTVRSLPGALLDEVRGIDREAARRALAGTALAFGTDQGGTRPTGPVVLGAGTDRIRVVERLLPILRQRYDSVERDGDAVVASEETFDPDLARTLGVPEGPAFGRLADGQAVEVDGRTIPPDAVREKRERRFPIGE
jgi:D-aminoacyl-tRNA deacylase